MHKIIHRGISIAAAFAGAMTMLAASTAARAVPSYARQTGSECAACHIGAYGPHLTPYGIRFKLGGYTDSDGKGGKIPLAAQIQATYTKPSASNPTSQGASDIRITEADIYLAGKLFDNVGSYVRLKHSEGPGNTTFTQVDDMDIRFAKETKLAEKSLTWGISVNNHPGISDALDDLPAWGFGAIGPGRDAITGTMTGTLLNHWQGGLGDRVIGATGYGYLDNNWYGELGTYRSLSQAAQHKLGETDFLATRDVGDPGKLGGTAYWRLAYMQDMKTQFYSFGLVGLNTKLQPGPARTVPSDKISDFGVDASYEYLGSRDHVVQLRASYIHEKRDYGSTPPNPFYPPQLGLPTGTLNEKTLAATYSYKQTVGFTLAQTRSSASADPARFLAYGMPDTTFTFLQTMWAPFGKEDSWGAGARNMQFGTIWIRFDKFNGSSTSIFGMGPFIPPVNSKDLNSFLLYGKLAF